MTHKTIITDCVVSFWFVQFTGAITTFMRFYPTLKARYDYGLLIFLLTFCLVIVSGYRDVELFEIAHKRLSTIVVGCITAIVICVCICPVWIGADLHKLVASNMEKLGDFLEGTIPQKYEWNRSLFRSRIIYFCLVNNNNNNHNNNTPKQNVFINI